MRRLVLLIALLVLPAGPASAGRPGFRLPLAGLPAVVHPFAPPSTRFGTGHRGVDLRASIGGPVLAAGPGRVTYAGLLAGRGVVTVTHDGGLRTTYEPVAATVHVGQAVAAGGVLGTLAAGHPGCPGCLHWGLLRGQTYLDPMALLVPPEVRLLPLPGVGPAARLQTARPATSSWSDPGRSLGAVAATGALLLGVGLLRGRSHPTAAPPGGTVIDLRAERRRRRVA